jgi:hypothetical protein
VDVLRKHFLPKGFKTSDYENYLGQMVEQHRHFAIRHRNERACFLRYPDFINQFESIILPHFSLPFSGKEKEGAKQMAEYESKKAEPVLYRTH